MFNTFTSVVFEDENNKNDKIIITLSGLKWDEFSCALDNMLNGNVNNEYNVATVVDRNTGNIVVLESLGEGDEVSIVIKVSYGGNDNIEKRIELDMYAADSLWMEVSSL